MLFRSKINALGAEIVTDTPEQFAAYIRAETAKWGKLIREIGVKPE